MAMYGEQTTGSRRTMGFGFVVALHVGLIYALANGLGESVVEAVAPPIVLDLIEETVTPPEPPPPPPPPELAPPPEAFVPAPEIAVDLPPPPAESTAISNTQSETRTTPPPQIGDGLVVDPTFAGRKPPYPAASKRLGEEGRTTLQVYVVFATGKVTEASVAKSSGYARLDKAAVDYALNTLRFKAVEGKPAGTWTTYVVNWKIEEE